MARQSLSPIGLSRGDGFVTVGRNRFPIFGTPLTPPHAEALAVAHNLAWFTNYIFSGRFARFWIFTLVNQRSVSVLSEFTR